MTVRELPLADRPREKMLAAGPSVLTESELLAILLRTGARGLSAPDLARRLLQEARQSNRGAAVATSLPSGPGQEVCEELAGLRLLAGARPQELVRLIPGIGQAKACQLAAAFELGRRLQRLAVRRQGIHSPHDAGRFALGQDWTADREQFKVILLNAKNQVIDVESISEGTLNSALVHPREVFKPAIRRSAFALIVAHNHPSGDPSPSREDQEVTRRLLAAGETLGIQMLDHVIVGDGTYYSFREQGRMRSC
jgi:DNA repair protein RadC